MKQESTIQQAARRLIQVGGEIAAKDKIGEAFDESTLSLLISGFQSDFWRKLSEAYLGQITGDLQRAIFPNQLSQSDRIALLDKVAARLSLLGEPQALIQLLKSKQALVESRQRHEDGA